VEKPASQRGEYLEKLKEEVQYQWSEQSTLGIVEEENERTRSDEHRGPVLIYISQNSSIP